MSAEEEDLVAAPYVAGERVPLPADINVTSTGGEMAFHPFKDIIAAGTMDGHVKVYSYTADSSKSNHRLMSFGHHKESCRTVQFSASGDYLFSGSSDAKIHVIALDTGTVTRQLAIEDGEAIYTLLPIDNYLLASGDDDGRVVLWDYRRENPIMDLRPCQEYISCLRISSDKKTLLATSGEGSLTAFNLPSRKVDVQSELFNSEFMTAAIVKNQTKLVVGSSDGALNFFNWGEWGNISDRFPCRSGSVNVIVCVNDDIICAGCEDGCIRAIQLHPNRIIGIVGKHDELPVEGLCVSHDYRFLGSCSFDGKIKFHDLSALKNVNSKSNKKTRKANAVTPSKGDDFFSSLA